MTLRVRLLFATLILSFAITTAFGWVIRNAWQSSEARRFETEFQDAVRHLEGELSARPHLLAEQLRPLCDHDPTVDSALVGLRSQTLMARYLSIRGRVGQMQSALGLDELVLLTSEGEILAAAGQAQDLPRSELISWAQTRVREPGYRAESPKAIEAACLHQQGRTWVALVGAVHLAPLLAQAGTKTQLELSLIEANAPLPPEDPRRMTGARVLEHLAGTRLVASRSRGSLDATLLDLDVLVLSVAAAILLGALLIAYFLSRGLSGPVVKFAENTRKAVQGTAQELPLVGGPELVQAARAFNETLRDLKALRERLRATERIAARREVARRVAHEIKNPLSPIRTSVETLQKLKARAHPDFDAYFDETTRTVLSEVKRLSRLVSHFSEYARLPSPEPEKVNPDEMVRAIVSLHQSMGQELEVSIEDDLPQIHADKDQIAQVLTNLIKNALEATRSQSDGQVKVTVRKTSSGGNQGVEIEVRDNGPGLSQQALTHLFEPYATTKEGGTGLGLPISHRIAVEHGGDLTYKTPEGRGASFVLFLPLLGPPTLEA